MRAIDNTIIVYCGVFGDFFFEFVSERESLEIDHIVNRLD